MTEPRSRVVRFPRRHSPIPKNYVPPRDAQGDAELRAGMLTDLFDELISKKGEYPEGLQVLAASLFGKDLLDEMVVLYRQALSEARGDDDPE